MKDDASTIVTGILIQSEIERRNNEILREQNDKSKRLDEEKKALQEQKEGFEKKNKEIKKDNAYLQDDVETLVIQNNTLYEMVENLQEEVQEYKKLLCKPMQEIAEANGNFKETYEKQMLIMAEWMVSQKAFKELAIQFGMEQGLTPDDVIDAGNLKKLDVLDNKNNSEHGTNGNDITTITNRTEEIKKKINSQLNK